MGTLRNLAGHIGTLDGVLSRLRFLLCVWLILGVAAPALAVEGLVEVSGGYDDNPELTDRPRPTAFLGTEAEASQRLRFERLRPLGFDLTARAGYREFSRGGDSYRLQGRIGADYPLVRLGLVTSLFLGGEIYRDSLVPEDERNAALCGIGLEWPATNRLSFSLDQSWQWLDYQNRAEPLVGRAFSGGGFGSGNSMLGASWGSSSGRDGASGADPGQEVPLQRRAGAGQGPRQGSLAPRDDRLERTAAGLSYALWSKTTLEFSAEMARLHSTVRTEAFRRWGAGTGLVWAPALRWRLEGRLLWMETDYERAPQRRDRVDRTRGVSLRASRQVGEVEIFVLTTYADNDSPVRSEAYTQRTVSVGFVWGF